MSKAHARGSTGKGIAGLALVAAALSAGALAGEEPWTLDLAPAVTMPAGTARLGDVVTMPVPADAAAVAVAPGGLPGDVRVVSGRGILRQLVLAGLAGGVRLTGAERCTLRFAGAELGTDTLAARVADALAPLMPAAAADAPPSRVDVSLAASRLTVDGDWRVEVSQDAPLAPGDNLVAVTVVAGEQRHRLTARVTLHAFARTATAVRRLAPRQPVPAEALVWSWQDLAAAGSDPVVDPAELAGMVTTREVRAGDLIRRDGLAPVPLVRAGDLVELVVRRGRVSATVRGTCRQDGGMDDVVTVRNELTGRLAAGRVAGPGLVLVRN